MTWDVTMVMDGRGGLLMFLEPFCKNSCRLSNVYIFTTLISVYDPTLVGDRIFVLGGHEQVFYGLTSFKVYLYTIFWQVFLILSLSPCWYGTTICIFLLLVVVWPVWLLLFLLLLLDGIWLSILALFMAQMGYLHFWRAWHRWSSSFFCSCGSEHIVLGLWYRVQIQKLQGSPTLWHHHVFGNAWG